jgi:hypothetical protein
MRIWCTAALFTFAMGISQARAELSERQWRALEGLARGRFGGRWQDFETNQLAGLRQRADAYLENLRTRFLVDGLVTALRCEAVGSTNVVRYEDLGESATLTGLALGATAFHYAVTREPTALNDVRALLDGLERLANTTSRPGFLPAFAGKASDPLFKPVYESIGGPDPRRPGFGRLAHASETNSNIVWIGGVSRERCMATTFGLAITWQVVRDQKIRDQTVRIMTAMVDRVKADHWILDDGFGETAFVSPILAASMIRAGASLAGLKYETFYADRAKEVLSLSLTPPAPYADNHQAVMSALGCLILARLDIDSTRRVLFQERLTQLWRQSVKLMNPLVAAASAESFERPPSESGMLSVIEGILDQFPDPPRLMAAPAPPDPEFMTTIEANGAKWSRFALPMTNQPPALFQWFQSPCTLGNAKAEPVEFPGVDYLLAFWMARDGSVLPSEDAPQPAPKPRAKPGRTNAPPAGVRTPPSLGR